MKKTIFFLFALAFLFLSTPSFAEESQVIPGEIIVKYKDGQTPEELQEKAQQRKSRIPILGGMINAVEDLSARRQGDKTTEEKIQEIKNAEEKNPVATTEDVFEDAEKKNPNSILTDVKLIKTENTSTSVTELEKSYESLSSVEYAQPNYKMKSSTTTPNDPSFPQMWNLSKIKMGNAWDIIKGSRQIKVAVIDTGIDASHQELGGSSIPERPMDKIITSPLNVDPYHGVLKIDQDRMAYISNGQIFVRNSLTNDPLTPTKTINALYPDLYPTALAFSDNYVAYTAVGNPNQSGIFLYNLTTNEHFRVATAHAITTMGIRNGKLFYSRDGDDWGLKQYDIATKIETHLDRIGDFLLVPVTEGNQIIYPIPGSSCYEKARIYNTTTKQTTDIFPPEIGPILDFKGNKILYVACSNSNFDPTWSTYYVYDLTTKIATRLSTNSQKVGTHKSDYLINISWSNKGFIRNGVVFLSKGDTKMIAYDIVQNRYAQINLKKNVHAVDAQGNKMCFISSDKYIYCHTYDPSASYLIPSMFNDRVVGGYNFVSNDDFPFDGQSHGTHVAGTIGAITNNNNGIAGINWDVSFLAIKVLDDSGSGSTSDVLQGIYYAADNGAKVINLSLGGYVGPGGCQQHDPATQTAINYAVQKGVVVVVAAGNDDDDTSFYTPASCNGSLVVGATGPTDQRSYYSNYGQRVDIAAPGGDSKYCSDQSSCLIYSTVLDNSYAYYQGTSMATPHVVGAVALMLAKNPTLSPAQIKLVLKSSADSISTDKLVGKRLNVYAALQAVNAPPLPTPTLIPTATLIPTPTPVPGDIDGNGTVDIADFNVWRDEFIGVSQQKKSDSNHDGKIDLIDYILWRNAYH